MKLDLSKVQDFLLKTQDAHLKPHAITEAHRDTPGKLALDFAFYDYAKEQWELRAGLIVLYDNGKIWFRNEWHYNDLSVLQQALPLMSKAITEAEVEQ